MQNNKKLSIILMILLLFATQACTDIFLSGLPTMAREFNTSMDITNLTISVYNYSQAFCVLLIGIISDLHGRRSPILTCLLLYIVASIWIALSSSILMIIILRAVQALGSAAVFIILRLIIKDTMDKKAQIHATGLLVIGLVLSPILAPAIGAWIVRFSSWRNCFWAIALFAIPLFIWAWIAIPETHHRQQEFRSSFSAKSLLLNYYLVLKDSYFISLALTLGAAFAAFYAFISISSYVYINQLSIQETYYAYIFIGIAVSYLLGNRVMSKLNAHNIAPRTIVAYGIATSLLATVFLLPTFFIEAKLALIIFITLGTCLLRLATAFINPPIQVMITNHFQDKGSYALGLLTCIQYSFAAIGTMTVSGLPFQPSINFVTSTCFFVIVSLIGYLLAAKTWPLNSLVM